MATLRRIAPFIDKVKIGKLNYYPSDIDWAKSAGRLKKSARASALTITLKNRSERK